MSGKFSVQSVVPGRSERANYDDEDEENSESVEDRALHYWKLLHWYSQSNEDDADDENKDEAVRLAMLASTTGRFLVACFRFADRYNLTLWHLEFSFFSLYLILFTVGK